MRHAAASGRRRIRHHRDRGTLEQIAKIVFVHISRELNIGISGALLAHGLHISRNLGMVGSRNHQLRIRKLRAHQTEGFDHQFETLVRSPFPEGQNAMRMPAPRQVRILRPVRENSVSSYVHVIAPILVRKDFAISGHQHRDRVRQQQHAGRDRARHPVSAGEANPEIFQIDGVHQMMQRNVRVAPGHAGEQGQRQSSKRIRRPVPECAEQKIEPDDIGPAFSYCRQQSVDAARLVRRPAAHYRKTWELRQERNAGSSGAYLIGQDRQIDKLVALQLARNVKTVFAQSSMARRKGTYQTYFH